jgi:Mg-chelatase subunit ChlD
MKTLENLVIIFLIFSLVSNTNSQTLTINRARHHKDKSGPYTPLVVSLSIPDTNKKEKPVDLICIVDVSGSMYGERIELVQKSLNFLVYKLTNDDNLALIKFSDSAHLEFNFTRMTQENKEIISTKINNLYASGTTNIYSGLELGLSLLTSNYSSGDRIASMILLSDGYDNTNRSKVYSNFKDLLERTNKTDYVFTLNSFAYGDDNDYELLNSIALIKPGSYFFIHILLSLVI